MKRKGMHKEQINHGKKKHCQRQYVYVESNLAMLFAWAVVIRKNHLERECALDLNFSP